MKKVTSVDNVDFSLMKTNNKLKKFKYKSENVKGRKRLKLLTNINDASEVEYKSRDF